MTQSKHHKAKHKNQYKMKSANADEGKGADKNKIIENLESAKDAKNIKGAESARNAKGSKGSKGSKGARDAKGSKSSKGAKSARDAKEKARLCATQALYQMTISQQSLSDILDEFVAHRLPACNDGCAGDVAHFTMLLEGAQYKRDEITQYIISFLRKDWRVDRLDPTMLALLQLGAWEILFCAHIPNKVAVAEYTYLAHQFFNLKQAGMVNAILDNIAKSNLYKQNQARANNKPSKPQ